MTRECYADGQDGVFVERVGLERRALRSVGWESGRLRGLRLAGLGFRKRSW